MGSGDVTVFGAFVRGAGSGCAERSGAKTIRQLARSKNVVFIEDE
jgi:hypothetical protein